MIPWDFSAYLSYDLSYFSDDSCAWDEPLEGNTLKQWLSIVEEIGSLSVIKLPRCYYLPDVEPCDTQIHGFCDASSQAYAAVLYMRSIYPNGSFSVKIIASKTRVVPVKTLIIPGLELLGAVLLARLGNTVCKSLTHQYNLTYWIDSTAALCWITNDKPWKQYVSNRVKEICQLTNRDQWRHCPGQLNPADLPSRGLKSSDLVDNQVWWEGPQFLSLAESNWPHNVACEENEDAYFELNKNADDKEVTFTMLATTDEGVDTVKIDQVIDYTRFSQYSRLIRTTALVLQFIKACQKQRSEDCRLKLTATELDNAASEMLD